jgi:hypothetical protein
MVAKNPSDFGIKSADKDFFNIAPGGVGCDAGSL